MGLALTIHAWWLIPYLIVGAALWIPLEWWAWRRTAPRTPYFWRSLWRAIKRRPLVPIATIVLWPAALWEVIYG